ncbi:RNA-guided endonuclease TnpB family protein [Thermosulfurimonas sp. F29]|uniref:RNA-guided endonuclease InsQ/TnpB family protein n=1 Tax=Thermosulfurimonas sp. F29 TaxID=2867247 RepID=UPI001C832D4F|nr:RNA-guided endonuclease TnpB family protein [Thermosulfurimonas sp. F29]MBX6423429.1 transposase [Thermosulfurimonas sp. F29]
MLPTRRERRILKEIGDRVSALWNAANFVCRQRFFKGEKVPSYGELCSLMKNTPEYQALPSDIAQEVLKKLRQAWTSFFRLKALYAMGKISEKPSPPRYRKDRTTGKRFSDWIPVKSARAYAVDGDWFHLTLPADMRKRPGDRLSVLYKGTMRFRGKRTTCEIKYDAARDRWYARIQTEIRTVKKTGKRRAAIDLGAKRTAALVIEGVPVGIVFSARNLWKDYRYWTRRIAELQSLLASQGLKTSRRLKKLYRKRTARLEHALRAFARTVAEILKAHDVGLLKVGYPKECRSEMRFGRNNIKVHNFWAFLKAIRYLKDACERRGIKVEPVDETGTSERCAVCGEEVKRPKRSVVICPEHGRMHADVNAAWNILGETPDYGDGPEAGLAWVTCEWDKHSWNPRRQSLSRVPSAAEVLRVASLRIPRL